MQSILLILLCLLEYSAFAQDFSDFELYFDARESRFNREDGRKEFVGDVVAIGGGVFLAADRIAYNEEEQVMSGEGHVLLLFGNSAFVGDAVEFYMASKTFKVEKALMISNSVEDRDFLLQEILGFSNEELRFEEERSRQIVNLDNRRKDFLINAARRYEYENAQVDELVNAYSVLLRQRSLIESQENAALAELDGKRRGAFKRRRAFWRKKKSALTDTLQNELSDSYYFKIEGDRIEKIDALTFEAEKAHWTSCKCDVDEEPAWGFHAERIQSQPGGYAVMDNAVLTVKGIPVIYLPRMTIPLKDKRQSGLLLPTFVHRKETGNVFSQPLFLNFSESTDATITWDFMEKRGQRLGIEYRSQNRIYSGWDLNLEAMRDKKWLSQRSQRKALRDSYLRGMLRARNTLPGASIEESVAQQALNNSEWWEENNLQECLNDNVDPDACLEENGFGRIEPPANAWRGKYAWSGLSILAPRLSFVSSGKIYSDHRYTEDTYIARTFEEAFSSSGTETFANSDFQFHLDAPDFYAGVSSHLVDSSLLNNDIYDGHQVPFQLNLQSRLFNLTPNARDYPIYAQVDYTQKRIVLLTKELDSYGPSVKDKSLKDGSWRNFRVSSVGPIANEGVVQIDHFENFEIREIGYSLDESDKAQISSWNAGLQFFLPIEGQTQVGVSQVGSRMLPLFLRHSFDFGLRLSFRPHTERSTDYGQASTDGSLDVPTYFSADAVADEYNDFYNRRDNLTSNKSITFSTNHSWALFSTAQENLKKDVVLKKSDGLSSKEILEEARLEVLHHLAATRIRGNQQLKLTQVDYRVPVSFHADITYDFKKAEAREELEPVRAEILARNNQLEDGQTAEALPTLPEPWSNLKAALAVNHAGYSLLSNVEYDFYKKISTKVNLSFALPRMFDTSASLGYTVEKSPNLSVFGELTAPKTITRSFTVSNQSLSALQLVASLARKEIDDSGSDALFESKAGFEYLSDSDCWGLSFLRTKAFEDSEEQADYRIELNIVFMGTKRSLPNMASSLLRGVARDTDS